MKLVKEHINFQRGLDPREAMGVGIKSKIKEWIEKTGDDLYNGIFRFPQDESLINDRIPIEDIYKYIHINKDLSIDANCRIDISADIYEYIPDYIRFNHVTGDFSCSFATRDDLWKNSFPKQIDGEVRFYGNHIIGQEDIYKICKVDKIIFKD